jgi:hypothetical protein
MLSRSYSSTGRVLTGANALDVSRIGMDQALLSRNTTLLDNAYRRSHAEIVIQDGVGADGIRADGAFGMTALVLLESYIMAYGPAIRST